ncbi:MAG: chorismate synthase, partial [Thermotogaceae bacterium]|nr:chorismate synthase [Thermotogaceae bacterium]
MKITISGDSHGEMMIGVLEGFPAGFKVDEKELNQDLKRRQNAYGRSSRMRMEK